MITTPLKALWNEAKLIALWSRETHLENGKWKKIFLGIMEDTVTTTLVIVKLSSLINIL